MDQLTDMDLIDLYMEVKHSTDQLILCQQQLNQDLTLFNRIRTEDTIETVISGFFPTISQFETYLNTITDHQGLSEVGQRELYQDSLFTATKNLLLKFWRLIVQTVSQIYNWLFGICHSSRQQQRERILATLDVKDFHIDKEFLIVAPKAEEFFAYLQNAKFIRAGILMNVPIMLNTIMRYMNFVDARLNHESGTVVEEEALREDHFPDILLRWLVMIKPEPAIRCIAGDQLIPIKAFQLKMYNTEGWNESILLMRMIAACKSVANDLNALNVPGGVMEGFKIMLQRGNHLQAVLQHLNQDDEMTEVVATLKRMQSDLLQLTSWLTRLFAWSDTLTDEFINIAEQLKQQGITHVSY